MANIRIISNADFDSATLTSSLAMAANAPITNLQIGLRAKVARTASVASWTISGVYPDAKSVSAVSLYKHNFSSLATMTVQLYSDTALTIQKGATFTATLGGVAKEFGLAFQPAGWGLGGVIWGGATFDAWPASYFTTWFTTVEAVMGFKITITDAGAATYLEIGRIYMGDYWSPSVNVSYGATMGWQEQSKQFRTDGGSLRTEGYEPYRTFDLAFDVLNEAERAELLTMIRKLGMRKDFFMSVAPTAGGNLENDYTSAVKLTSMPKFSTPYYDNYTTNITLEEV